MEKTLQLEAGLHSLCTSEYEAVESHPALLCFSPSWILVLRLSSHHVKPGSNIDFGQSGVNHWLETGTIQPCAGEAAVKIRAEGRATVFLIACFRGENIDTGHIPLGKDARPASLVYNKWAKQMSVQKRLQAITVKFPSPGEAGSAPFRVSWSLAPNF